LTGVNLKNQNMLQKIIDTFTRPRHPWRKIEFDELAEIYTSMSIRSFGFGIIGIFVPIYLYFNSYSLQDIFFFYFLFFLFRIPISVISAYVVARVGPKHSIAISTILLTVFLAQLLTIDMFEWPLYILALSFTITNGLFFIAYNTDFSKIKDTNHGGKELGWLYIFERLGSALGPLVGGILASLFAPELTIAVAIIALLASLIPLFITNEPVRTHQKITFKNFKWRRHTRDYLAIGAYGIDINATQMLWPLFIGVTIFTEGTYAKIGLLSGIALGVSVFSALMFGKFVDNKKGYYLLRFGTIINTGGLLLRSFITTAGGAVAVSMLSEPLSLAYKIPLVKGYYDAADSEEGYRIVYLTVGEIVSAVAKAMFFAGLFVACFVFDPSLVLKYSFIIAGFLSLGMLVQRFPALKRV
jgi:MFS family permease